jgi:hypothetical protein
MKRVLPALGILLAACQGEGEPTFPRSDGTSVPLPAECQVQSDAKAPFTTRFVLTNEGSRSVFLAVEPSCALSAVVSSCASGFSDDLAWHLLGVCPCQGNCPVGGPSCEPAGTEVPPGSRAEVAWQATIGLLSTRNGEMCSAGTRDLPAGRYRFSTKAFATPEDAVAGAPALLTLTKEFAMPAPNGTVEIGFTP